MKMKFVAAAAVAACLVAGGANATTTNLGAAPIGVPLSFGGYAVPGPFLDIFTFSLPANGGSGYSVSDFTLLPLMFDTAFTSFALISNADGIVGTGDDTTVASAFSVGSDAMTLTWGASGAGNYYLAVGGVATGPSGGIYNGAISVTAVPEPETLAMMLAGLGALGFLARRRQNG